MKKKAFAGTLLSGVFLFGGLSFAQEAGEPNDKAKRYHALLLKRPGNPTVFGRFVDAWLNTGDQKGMKSWLEESAKTGGAPEWRVLADFHEYLGDDEEALDAFNQAVAGDEKDATLRLARAKLHAKLLSFEAGLKDLEVALADEKLGVEASKLKGVYLARAGRIDEAVTALKAVIERFPKDEELREDLIEVEVAEGLYEDAIAASQALVAMTKDPYKKALRQLRLGDIQILGSKQAEGLETYETIMASTGAGTWLEREVLAQVERVFMREDNVQGLRDFFQKLRETYPRRVSVRKALSRQMALNGEMDEAVALFREVLKITPGDVGNREEFIAFLETNERWKDAREELAELLKMRENDPLLWERMATIEEKLKDEEGVKVALAKIRDLKKGTPDGLIAVATLYTQVELLEEAEALLREGREAFPESVEMTEALASFLIQNKKEEEALAIWSEMAKTADREGLLRVARSLTGHGKSDQAFQLLQARMGEFGQDVLILTQFCNLAFSAEEGLIALPFGLELVRQASAPSDLESAIKTAVRVIKRAGKLDETLLELEEKEGARISEQCLIADLYVMQGDTLKALEVLSAAEKADEGLLARFYRVRFEESRGELESAIASLRAIIELPEGRKTVHVRRLVGLLERLDDLPGALSAVDDWKRMAPGDQAAWKRKAELLSIHGEPDKAVLELRRMIGKFGAEEDSRALLAVALLEANEHLPAQRIYKQLYEEGEDLAAKLKWVGELAKMAEKEGTLDELLEDFERRKRENANSVAPLLAIAEIYRSLNRYEERRSALLEASRRRPNDIKLLQQIADVEVRAGEFERAVGLLKDAEKRDTTSGTREKLAELYLENGEFQEGLRLLKEVSGYREDPRKIEKTVLSLMALSEWELVVQNLTEFTRQHSDDWRLSYLLAIALEMEDQQKEALKIYRRLTEVDSSIKGLKPLFDPKSPQVRYWVNRMNSSSEFKGWPLLKWIESKVDSDQRALGRSRSSYRNSYGGLLLSLPGTPEELRMLSYLRALRIAGEFEEEEREEVVKNLTLKGVEDLELYGLSQGDRAKYFARIDELLKEDPDNRKYQEIWVSNRRSAGEDFKPDPERLQQILKVVTKDNQQLGIRLIFGMVQREELERSEAAVMVEEVMKTTPKGDDRETGLSMLAYYLGRDKGGDGAFDFVTQSLLSKAVSEEVKPKDRLWIDRSLTLAMAKGDSDSTLILLNRISKWLMEEKQISSLVSTGNQWGSNSYHHSRSWSSSQTGVLSLPTFPPGQIKGIPSVISSLVGEKLEFNVLKSDSKLENRRAELRALLKDQTKKEKPEEQEQDPLETFQGRVNEIEHPALRAFVGAALGDKEAFKTYVDSVKESQNIDDLNFAASFYWKEKKYVEAYEVFDRMRMQTLSRAERLKVDGQLAMTGAFLVDQKELEWNLESAQRAALRLRKSLTNVNEKKALISLLTKLGLQEEAQKALRKSTLSARSGSSSRAAQRTGSQGVVALATEGRLEEAVREAIKSIKGYQRNQHSHYELNRMVETLKKLDLVEATLEKLNPGESLSINRRLSYANLAMAFQKKELALPVFAALLKERPDLTEARIGLYMCQPEDKRSFQDFLGDDQEEIDFEKLQDVMSSLWNKADNQLDETLALFDLTTSILSQIEPDPDPERNFSWVPYHVLSAAYDSYYNSIRVGSLFETRQGSTFDKDKTVLFDEAAKKTFVEMLRHPQTAEQGFMMLMKARDNLKIEDEKMSAFAKASLLEVMRRKPLYSHSSQRSLWSLIRRNGTSSSYSLNDVPGPMTYLMSFGSVDDVLSEEVLASFKEHQPEKYTLLIFAKDLIAATPEEASALFLDWYGKRSEEVGGKDMSKFSIELVELSGNLLLFGLKPSSLADDLETKLLEIESHQWSGQRAFGKLSVKWLQWVAQNKDRAAVRKFIMEVCEKAMGPQSQWKFLAELGNDFLPDWYRQSSYALTTVLNDFCVVEEAVVPLMELESEHQFAKFVRNFSVRNAVSQKTQKLDTSEKLVGWMKETGLLVKQSDPKKRAQLALSLQTMVDVFPSFSTEEGQKVTAALEAEPLDPLLKELVLSRYRKSKDRVEKLAEAWDGNIETLKMMSELDSAASSRYFLRWFSAHKSLGKFAKLDGFLTTLQNREREKVRKDGQQRLADGIEIDADDYEGRSLWAEICKVAEVDSELATKMVLQAFSKVPLNQALMNQGRTSGGVTVSALDSWSGRFFATLSESNYQIGFLEKIRIIDQIYRSEVGESLIELKLNRNNFAYYLRANFQNKLKAIDVPEGSSRKRIEIAFSEWTQEMNPEEESTFVALVIPALLQSWSFNSEDLEGVSEWADQELRKDSELMADALVFIIEQSLSSHQKKKKRDKMLEAGREAFVRMLPRLDLPSPLAVEFASNTMASSRGELLFSGLEQWRWLSGTLAEYSNGVRNVQLSQVLGNLTILARQEFPEKVEASKLLLEAIDGTLVTPESLLLARNLSGSWHWLKGLLPIALAAGDQSLAKRLIQQNAANFRGDLAVMLDVATAIDPKTAAKLAPARTFPYRTENLPTYTKSTPAVVSSVLPALHARDRYRFEVMVASLQDTKTEEDRAETLRAARLLALTGRFEEEAPKDRGPRYQLLNLFGTEPACVSALVGEFQKVAEKTTLAAALTFQDQGGSPVNGSDLVNIIQLWLRGELKAGRPAPMQNTISLLIKHSSGNNSYQIRRTGSDLIYKLEDYLFLEALADPDKAPAMAELSRKNVKDRMLLEKGATDTETRSLIWMDLLVHILAGETKTWYEQVEALDKSAQGIYGGPLGEMNRGALQRVAQREVFVKDDQSENRISLMTKVLSDPVFLEKAMVHHTRLSALLDAGLIRRKELRRLIEGLPDENPRKAEFLMEVAGVSGWRDGNIKTAKELYAKAHKLALSQENTAIVHLIDALHARLLGQKDRISEAWKIGQRVDPELLSESDQKWFKKESVKWKQKATKSPKSTEPKAPTKK